MKSKIGTAQWSSNLAEQIESLRSGIQNLSSTVERIAKEQIPCARSRATEALTMPRKPLSGIRSLLSPSRWVWDF